MSEVNGHKPFESVDTPKYLSEEVAGEFGFHINWKVLPHWADFTVWAVRAREGEGGKPIFWKKNTASIPAESMEQAEPYLTGFVKWDGCCEFTFNDTHFCGGEQLVKHLALMKYLYLRAGALSGHNHAESPWPKAKAK